MWFLSRERRWGEIKEMLFAWRLISKACLLDFPQNDTSNIRPGSDEREHEIISSLGLFLAFSCYLRVRQDSYHGTVEWT